MTNTNILNSCTLCPRMCNADRSSNSTGICGETWKVKIARAALHMWEEPCISGSNGSGAIFFCGCPMRCIFCQNYDIANAKAGKEVTIQRLSDIMLELEAKGANNINLVTPTHYVPQIIEALEKAKDKGLNIPIVYNTSGYERVETLKMLEGLVDIYLPDYKYTDRVTAQNYSKAGDYCDVITAALDEMYRQTGVPAFNNHNIMTKGMIVRHLVLPGHVKDAKAVIKYLYETYGDNIYISIMNQYTPCAKFEMYPELERKLTKREYETVVDYAIELGVENAFIQEGGTAKESFVPAFDYTGV